MPYQKCKIYNDGSHFIMDDDVACTIGQEDKKLLLFDNFNCWDEGCLVGQVSKEVIDQMPKAN